MEGREADARQLCTNIACITSCPGVCSQADPRPTRCQPIVPGHLQYVVYACKHAKMRLMGPLHNMPELGIYKPYRCVFNQMSHPCVPGCAPMCSPRDKNEMPIPGRPAGMPKRTGL